MTKQRRKEQVSDEELLAFFRECESAKSFRGAMLHYVRQRKDHGTNTPVTDDAELNAYKQAMTLYEEVQRKIGGK